MPRKKLRPDNTPYVFAYDIKIVEVPDIVFNTARNQQALWNWMVVQHEKLVTEIQDADKEAKKLAYEDFWKRAYCYVRDQGEGLSLPTWAKWQIYDSFKASQQAWARKTGGMPSVKHGLRKIKIEHRTDSGGVPVSWLYRDSDIKHTLLRKDNGLTRGYFSINGERIHFETVLHQRAEDDSLPSIQTDCILKRIALCGEYEPAFREWRWKIIFLVERPPQEIIHGNVAVGMDLGWRIREDGLRIAVIYTPLESYEIYLPFNLANHSERKQIERYSNGTEVTRDIRQVWEMQTIQDGLLEECKAGLKELDRSNWPTAANESMSGILKMRAGGLRRIRRALQEAQVDCPILDEWLSRHIELAKRIRKAQIRITSTKTVMYRNLAAWLSRHCAALAWEDDLSLKDLAEDDTNQEAIKRAQKHRQFAGLFRLRQFIREKMNDRIPQISGSYSTQECYYCGGKIEPSGSLYLICENGHRIDQDWNAARVLYDRLPEELRAVPGRKLSVDRSQISRNIRVLSP